MEMGNEQGVDDPPRKSRKSVACCLVTTAAILATTAVVLAILGFTVFKPKRPITTVDSMTLSSFRVTPDIFNLKVHVNLNLNVDLSVINPNNVGFEYSSATTYLLYKNDVVGQAPIPEGKIDAHSTAPMNLTLTLMADKLIPESGFFAAVIAGSLPLTTSLTISGKITIQNLFRFHVVSSSTCDLSINVLTQTVDRSDCKYDTKL